MGSKNLIPHKEYKLFESNDIAKYGIMSVAGNALKPIQYKVLMYMLWKGFQQPLEQVDCVELSLSELCYALGYSKDSNCNFSHNKKNVGAVVKSLMSQELTIHDMKEDMYISFIWVQTVAVSYSKDYIAVRFNTDLARHFGKELKKNFTVVKLKYLNRLSTSAAVILYAFFCRYSNMRIFNYSTDEVARLLTGDPEYKYKYLKRDYLLPAIESINRMTDLYVKLHENLERRKVVSLSFSIARAAAQDELECYMEFNSVKFDELEICPYNAKWMESYDYDMSTQKYIPKLANMEDGVNNEFP